MLQQTTAYESLTDPEPTSLCDHWRVSLIRRTTHFVQLQLTSPSHVQPKLTRLNVLPKKSALPAW